jgi:hypothetical protein
MSAKLVESWKYRKASGWKLSDASKEKIRKANRVQFSDPEKRAKHAEGMKRWAANLTDEDRATLAANARKSMSRRLPTAEMWDTLPEQEKQRRISGEDYKWMKYLTVEQQALIRRERHELHKKRMAAAMSEIWEKRRRGERPLFNSRGKQIVLSK